MSGYAWIPSRGMLFSFLVGFALPVTAADARVSESYGRLPLHFEANRGQAPEDVRFLSRGPGYGLFFTPSEAVLVLAKPNTDAKRAQAQPAVLRMSLVGAARKPLVSGTDELSGKANYFIGGDQSKWRTGIPTYAKVHYRNVYRGIDLVYYGNQRQLEYDFVVAPGADPKKIVLGFKGADKLEIDAQGELVLHAAGGEIRQHKPVIYQEVDGNRREIAGGYVRKGANRVGFQVADYDTTQPLIIDPVVLSYSTYLGGSDSDDGFAIAVDANGNAYVTGATRSINFPATSGAFRGTGTDAEVFVTKLDPTGSGLVYSTYLGGSGSEAGSGIAVDADGNAYVTGSTSSTDFPTTPGAFQPIGRGNPPSGSSDAFVTKLTPTGSTLLYSTYLGGSGFDEGRGIAVDAGGNAYVTGTTASNNFPTALAFQQAYGGGFSDVFVTKLNPAGSALVYSTFLGGGDADEARGIAVDAGGNAYATGVTASITFPTTLGAFQMIFGGGSQPPAGPKDAFVTKLDPTGSALAYSTYLGGSSDDWGSGIAVDADGNAYITGLTVSTNFPTTSGAFQPAKAASASRTVDAFVTKLNPAGSALVYSTYLGGSGSDEAFAIALNADGSAHVAGRTTSADYPTKNAFQSAHAGGTFDAFVTKLDPAGSTLVYSTYLGSFSNDQALGIAVTAGSAYVTGSTGSAGFPTANSFQPAFAGGASDAFVAKFGDVIPPSPSATPTRSEESAATEIGSWTTYGPETGTFSGGTIAASNQTAATATFAFTGTAVSWIGVKCNVCGIAAVSIDGGTPTMVNMSGPGAAGSLTSEPVFSASGLAKGATHTIAIIVTGTTNSSGFYVAVDAFDVTR